MKKCEVPAGRLKSGLKISDFTIFNAVKEMHQRDSLFRGVLGKDINLQTVIKKSKSYERG